jgi:hypothetical protein
MKTIALVTLTLLGSFSPAWAQSQPRTVGEKFDPKLVQYAHKMELAERRKVVRQELVKLVPNADLAKLKVELDGIRFQLKLGSDGAVLGAGQVSHVRSSPVFGTTGIVKWDSAPDEAALPKR